MPTNIIWPMIARLVTIMLVSVTSAVLPLHLFLVGSSMLITFSMILGGEIMKAIRRLLAVTASSAAIAALGATPGMAAPVNAPGVAPIPATCPGGDVVIVPPPGGGDWTPGFLENTHQLLIPYQFAFVITDSSGAVVDSFTQTKGASIPEGAITCTFSNTVTQDGETFTVNGQVVGVVRGKP